LHLGRQAVLRVDDLEDDAQLERAGIQRALPGAVNLRGRGWLRRSRLLGRALEIEFQRLKPCVKVPSISVASLLTVPS
jgi:hypothetical protein